MELLNKLYCMDNLDLLKSIPDKSIDLIYCDILYNTGRIFTTSDKNIAYIDKVGNNDKEIINFYDIRFEEMYRTLKDTGTILIHCDYRTSYIIQNLLNKKFIFQDKIIWKKSSTGKGAKNKKILSKDYDEIFYYTKTNDFTINKIDIPHNLTSLKEFKYYDEVNEKYFKIVPLGMYSKLSIEKMREQNLIYTSKFGKEYKKYYLTDFQNGNISNIWIDCNNLYNGNNKEMTKYPTQKPIALLERLIYMFSDKGDLVADFFMGSGTTCISAKLLSRYYLGCDINEDSVNLTKKRLLEID